MSVRAYRIVKKELAECPSFNLWHDTDLVDFLERGGGFFDARNYDGNGTIEVPTSRLKELLAGYRWEADDYRKKAIEADIAWAEKQQHEFVPYDCF